MLTGQGEVPADTEATPAAITRTNATIQRELKDRVSIDRGQGKIARKNERPPSGQQEAVARLEAHRIRNALHGQPALARDQRVAFDALVLAELDRPLSTQIKATAHVSAWVQQRQHI